MTTDNIFQFMTTMTLAQDVTFRSSNVDAVFTAPGRAQTLLVNSVGARRFTLKAGTQVALCGRHLDNAFFFAVRANPREKFVGMVVRPKAFAQLTAALNEGAVIPLEDGTVVDQTVAVAA